jgi:hypothetical protein
MTSERRIATLGAHFATVSSPLSENKAVLTALAHLLDHDNHDMREAAKELCRDEVLPLPTRTLTSFPHKRRQQCSHDNIKPSSISLAYLAPRISRVMVPSFRLKRFSYEFVRQFSSASVSRKLVWPQSSVTRKVWPQAGPGLFAKVTEALVTLYRLAVGGAPEIDLRDLRLF